MKLENRYTPLVLGAIATNCWIVPLDGPDEGTCAIIDPGDQAQVIIARMEKLNRYPQYILLTHGHFDHVAALPGLAEAFGAAANTGTADREPLCIAIHRDDAAYLGPDALPVHQKSFTAAAGNSAYVDSLWKPMPSPTRLLAEGDTIGPFRVLHLPGHTPGSVGFFLENRGALFSGDTLFRDGYGRTDLPGGNGKRLEESLRRLMAMDGDIRVYPGHGEATTISAERG